MCMSKLDAKVEVGEEKKDSGWCPKPDWFKVALPGRGWYAKVAGILKEQGLATVCQGAQCPNMGECWGRGTTTIMILGDTCTRRCRFCAVRKGNPGGVVDKEEPEKVASAIKNLGLRYAVLTSVDRDDLDDGGASIFAETIRAIKRRTPDVSVEVLTPDFGGRDELLDSMAQSGCDVLAHNVETVRRLSGQVRDPRCGYDLSLGVLEGYCRHGRGMVPVKSSIMLGLGETEQEIGETLRDLRAVGVSMVTLGQYLRPGKKHVPVQRYVTPGEFDNWRDVALGMGFAAVASGPMVRSSYNAEQLERDAADR